MPAPAPKSVTSVPLKPVEPEGKKQKISLTTPGMRPPMIPHSKPIPNTNTQPSIMVNGS